MRFLLLLCADEDTPVLDDLPGCVEWQDDMAARNALVTTVGLYPPETASTLRVRDGEVLLTDGPFAETKEQLGGFWVIQADDLDQALAWAEKCALACGRPIEVRPFDDGSGA